MTVLYSGTSQHLTQKSDYHRNSEQIRPRSIELMMPMRKIPTVLQARQQSEPYHGASCFEILAIESYSQEELLGPENTSKTLQSSQDFWLPQIKLAAL